MNQGLMAVGVKVLKFTFESSASAIPPLRQVLTPYQFAASPPVRQGSLRALRATGAQGRVQLDSDRHSSPDHQPPLDIPLGNGHSVQLLVAPANHFRGRPRHERGLLLRRAGHLQASYRSPAQVMDGERLPFPVGIVPRRLILKPAHQPLRGELLDQPGVVGLPLLCIVWKIMTLYVAG